MLTERIQAARAAKLHHACAIAESFDRLRTGQPEGCAPSRLYHLTSRQHDRLMAIRWRDSGQPGQYRPLIPRKYFPTI